MVEITQLSDAGVVNGTNKSRSAESEIVKTKAVDSSRILHYVSPRQLEAFENEQFGIEAEAEAIARRADAEELARKRLAKNGREPGIGRGRGRGRGSRLLSGLGLSAPTNFTASRGRPRGRPGRPRGSGFGRGSVTPRTRSPLLVTEDELEDIDATEASQGEQVSQRVIPETDSDEEMSDEVTQVYNSPSLMRSAFVANSALPTSPLASVRRPSTLTVLRGHPEVPDIEDTDSDLDQIGARSMSSAPMRLRAEYDHREGTIEETQEEHMDEGHHRRKRRRTESESLDFPTRATPLMSPLGRDDASSHMLMFRNESSLPEHDSESGSLDLPLAAPSSSVVQPSPQTLMFRNESSLPDYEVDSSDELRPVYAPFSLKPSQINGFGHTRGLDAAIPSSSPFSNHSDHGEDDVDAEAEVRAEDDADEYVVESIIDHYYDDEGMKHYLVKWEGYVDSHDWLPEEDLEGAAELVAEYNEKRRRAKGKDKVR